VDNHFAVLDAHGTPSRRARIHRLKAGCRQAASWHAPVWNDVEDPANSRWRVTTATTAASGYELRVHVVEAPDAQGLRVRDGGYALAGARPPELHDHVLGIGGLHTGIWPLYGYFDNGIFRAEGVSPLGGHAACGYLEGRLAGRRSIFASLVYLGGAAPAAVPTAVVIDDDGARVRGHVTLSTGQQLGVIFAF
jgi:hypothetical protein